jgi:hypothetical protein
MGDGLPPRGGSICPLAQSRGGGERDSAWGGRGSARHQGAYERGVARAAETTGGEAVATLAAATASAELPRKRKRGFSTPR